jgi:hypothetical protein
MAGSRRARRLLFLLPGLLALLPALSACGPVTPPEITAVAPAPSQGGTHTNIVFTIVFSVPMDPRSVETRLTIKSRRGKLPPGCDIRLAAEGRHTGCYFRWSDGNRIMRLLHPGHPLAVVTTYRINVAGGIRAASGAVNDLAHSWGFSTEGGPSLSSTFPGGGGNLGPYQAPALNFDRAMDPKAVASAVSLSPDPPGGYRVLPNPTVPGRFLVEPASPLVPGQTYQVTVTRAALDVDGNHLQAGGRFKFKVTGYGSSPALIFPAGPAVGQYTEVLATATPEQAGDPPGLRLLASPPTGSSYTVAVAAPDGQYLATELAGGHPLDVLDLATGKSTPVLGSTSSTMVAWAPTSQQLAFISGGALRVYTLASSQTVTLSATSSFSGPLGWRADGEVLAAVASSPGAAARVALLSPSLSAVTYLYPPATTLPAQSPVWSPQGDSLAFAVGQPADPSTWLYAPGTGADPFRQLAAGQPLAFLSSSVVLLREPSGALATVSTAGGPVDTLVGPVAGQYPEAVTSTATGRQLAFTRLEGHYLQLYLANDGANTQDRLTAFDSATPLNAGPPVFVGEPG